MVDRYVLAIKGGRVATVTIHPGRGRQRRRVPADHRELPVELTAIGGRARRHRGLESLYLEPEQPRRSTGRRRSSSIDVFKIYRSGSAETVALRGLDLRVEPREMVAIVGPSGSGKSTLLALAAAMDVPSAGDVRLDRALARGLDEVELADYRAQRVAIVFQSDNLWPALSARENVATACVSPGAPTPRATPREALATFGLGERAAPTPAALSGGEQQRVAIAAAAARRAPPGARRRADRRARRAKRGDRPRGACGASRHLRQRRLRRHPRRARRRRMRPCRRDSRREGGRMSVAVAARDGARRLPARSASSTARARRRVRRSRDVDLEIAAGEHRGAARPLRIGEDDAAPRPRRPRWSRPRERALEGRAARQPRRAPRAGAPGRRGSPTSSRARTCSRT